MNELKHSHERSRDRYSFKQNSVKVYGNGVLASLNMHHDSEGYIYMLE